MKLSDHEVARIQVIKNRLDAYAEELDDIRFRATDGVERQALERAAAKAEQAAFELVEFT